MAGGADELLGPKVSRVEFPCRATRCVACNVVRAKVVHGQRPRPNRHTTTTGKVARNPSRKVVRNAVHPPQSTNQRQLKGEVSSTRVLP